MHLLGQIQPVCAHIRSNTAFVLLLFSDPDGSLIDLSDQCLTKLEIPPNTTPVTIIADRNSISRIDNLEQCQNLRQVS